MRPLLHLLPPLPAPLPKTFAGANWGLDGHAYVAFGENACQIASYSTYTDVTLINGTATPIPDDPEAWLDVALEWSADALKAAFRAIKAHPITSAIIAVLVLVLCTFVPHVLDWKCAKSPPCKFLFKCVTYCCCCCCIPFIICLKRRRAKQARASNEKQAQFADYARKPAARTYQPDMV